MTTHPFDLTRVDKSWQECLERGLRKMNEAYLHALSTRNHWLPGPKNIFNAFSLPLSKVKYVMFGESPYPRHESANGYAFWDNAVEELWSDTGLSKKANRATSLRNMIKMLLIAEGLLSINDTSQAAIARIDKKKLVKTNRELFGNMLRNGFLLLNATLVLHEKNPGKDARAWLPFMQELLACLLQGAPQVRLILLGRIANRIDHILPPVPVKSLYAEHPYNISFIKQKEVLDFFAPLHLLVSI